MPDARLPAWGSRRSSGASRAWAGALADEVRRVQLRRRRAREAAHWEYRVATLEGSSDTWPDQLTAWRREGWELISVVQEAGAYRAVLERRV